MNWISTKRKLPEEGKYVLARCSKPNWIDNTDQDNVNCVVVKLFKGLSKKDRELYYKNSKRYHMYQFGDEHGNNLVPYEWMSFGGNKFFGQEITHWMPIKPFIF